MHKAFDSLAHTLAALIVLNLVAGIAMGRERVALIAVSILFIIFIVFEHKILYLALDKMGYKLPKEEEGDDEEE